MSAEGGILVPGNYLEWALASTEAVQRRVTCFDANLYFLCPRGARIAFRLLSPASLSSPLCIAKSAARIFLDHSRIADATVSVLDGFVPRRHRCRGPGSAQGCR